MADSSGSASPAAAPQADAPPPADAPAETPAESSGGDAESTSADEPAPEAEDEAAQEEGEEEEAATEGDEQEDEAEGEEEAAEEAAEEEAPVDPAAAAAAAEAAEAAGDVAFAGASSAALSHGVMTAAGRAVGGLMVSSRRAQQRHVTEFAAALQAACVWTQGTVARLEIERSSRGRAQDAACSLYWSAWVDHLHGACERHRELHKYVGGLADALDAQVAAHDAMREAVAFLPSSARVVLRAGRKREEENVALVAAGHQRMAGGGHLPVPTAPGEAVMDGPRDEVSSLDIALHGVSGTTDDVADGLAHLAWSLRVGVLGAPAADAAAVLDRRRRQTEASRTWLGAGSSARAAVLVPAVGGGLMRLTPEFDATATSIAQAGQGVSSSVTAMNGAVDGAQASLQVAAEMAMQAAMQAVAASNAAAGTHLATGEAVATPGSESPPASGTVTPPVMPKAGKVSSGAASVAEEGGCDLWLLVLAHAQAHVSLLNSKRAYLRNMRNLFESMREAERSRTATLGGIITRLHEVLSGTFGKLAGQVEPRVALVPAVDTYKDFVAFVEARVKRSLGPRIRTLVKSGVKAAGVSEEEVAPQPASGRAQPLPAPAHEGEVNVMELMTTPPMPVPSPLLNPLVKRWGVLQRQATGFSSLLSGWTPTVAVLTRGGYLHLFGPDVAHLATDPHLGSQPLPPVDPSGSKEHNAGIMGQARASHSGNPDAAETETKGDTTAPVVSLAIGQAALRGGCVAGDPGKLTRSGGVSVQFLPGVHETAFEVVVATPGMLYPTKNKFVFQAQDQASMVDWVVDIHDVAEGSAGTAALLVTGGASA